MAHRHQGARRMLARSTVAATSIVVASASAATVAFAQGYAPGAGPVSAPAGAFPTVLTTQTVGSGGGTLAASSGAANDSLIVPAGTFSQPTQVTLYGPNLASLTPLLPPGDQLVDAVAVAWSPASTPARSLTLTIVDSAVSPSAAVFKTTPTALTSFPGAQLQVGKAVLSFTTDPGFVVANAAGSGSSQAVVPSAPGLQGGGAAAMQAEGRGSVQWVPVAILLAGGIGLSGYLVRRRRA